MPKTPPAQRSHYRNRPPGQSKGVKYVRKAGLWCFYEHKNTDKADVLEWFMTEAEAVNRLTKALQA